MKRKRDGRREGEKDRARERAREKERERDLGVGENKGVACGIDRCLYDALCVSCPLSMMPFVCHALMSMMPSIYLHAKLHTRIKNLVKMSIPWVYVCVCRQMHSRVFVDTRIIPIRGELVIPYSVHLGQTSVWVRW